MKQIKLVSIILPTYNEAENIIDLVKEINKTVKFKKEIIVIDDNSPDGTSRIVEKFIKENKDIPLRLKTRKNDRGLTKSIKEGISIMKGDVAVWLDCDFSMPPVIIPKLLKQIEDGYDIASGSRYTSGGGVKYAVDSPDPIMGVLLSRLLNHVAHLLLGGSINDYTTGFIAARKNVLEKINLQGDYGEYATDFYVRSERNGFRIAEVPFVAQPRKKGESKTGQNIWQYTKRGRKYLWTIGRLMVQKN